MAWLAVDKNGAECIFNCKPFQKRDIWYNCLSDVGVELPKGSIKKLIDRNLTWDDEPVEI